ncbi:Type I restriction-modification system, specificity subunit S [Methanosarcina lacustris Z-7289]|uniref:Type I restriction-modification system, specificity subunit S n=1 Tax=Methanosarcina lacustris Z-7289 TaxID=1434111 RepID=A0A0E3S355_9EURY|nr:restriction endonuclease subunit S [Methanosarcina lacustris]AKB75314.1 Type I restriction-modification system, specificity subunit S [Methanosarcina lacustris Z-7289]
MNPDVFFKNFELLADAPNGVQKLRELILQLAVMGKLVGQDPNDEPASVLLEKIEAEKKRQIKEKLIRSESFAPIKEDELFFKIPANWEWIRLGQIGDWGAGSTPNRKNPDYYDGTTKWFKSGELNDGYIIESEEKITDLALKECSLRLNKKDDVLIAMYGATIGKVAILDTEATTNQAVCACTCFTGVYNRYLFFLLKAYLKYFASQGAGGAQPNISRIKIVNTVAPLPPLAEQKRIVSKVDELMALCDKLEARRQKKQEIQSKLNSAALDKMLSAENQEEFEQNWQRICENFDILYDNPENVGKLRQAILQLAVQGKLVEQNPEDEPASVLIEKIEAEEKKLLKEGKIQKAKNLQTVDVEEIPYNIPNGWLWIRFGKIAPHIEAGWSPMCEKRPKEGEEWGVLKISAVSWDVFNPSENKALPSNLNPRPEYEVKPNDFLMSRANTSELVGKSVIVEDTIPKLMISDKVLRLFFSSYSFKKYYNIFNNSQTARFYYAKEASGTSSSMKNISREVIYNMPVPLPPLEEQKRIFVKVEQLMGLCDELESKLRKSREDSGKLMETVVRGLLEGGAAEI